MSGPSARYDVAVLGAGIIGICTAIHLVKRGASVVLVDRRGAGEETSFGNAGILQREGVHPYAFPRNITKLLRYALNRQPDMHYQLSSLPAVLPFLWRYLLASNPESIRRTVAANIPLFAACLDEHAAIADEAGVGALIAKNGWIRILRSEDGSALDGELDELRSQGVNARRLNQSDLQELEPHVHTNAIAGAIHYRDPWSVSDPGALAKAYNALFEKLGGAFMLGDAMTARREAGAWTIDGRDGAAITAERMVVALGPWSKPFLDRLGLNLPMGIKRGYHRHVRPVGNDVLNRPILDEQNGYVLAPMAGGIRLTTGAEFARIDAPRTPVQIDRCLPLARQLFDLGAAADEEAWLGSRPCFPDMLPVMGEAPGLPGLWLNFGHAHHGLTLGPVAGRLVAELMSGETPLCDPAPYRAERFGGG